jgi:putative FmdB family regulatory protein
MPMYEYRCHTCGTVFELIQKFSDEPLTVHEGCGGPVERLLSAPALQFKGSGWYITDYARSKGANGSSKAGGETKSETKSEGSSDTGSKSETKSDSGAKSDTKTE